jgi:hypothetical protein
VSLLGKPYLLHCYFDDSGTHEASKIAVWGGVIGESDAYAALSQNWRAKLERPLPDKPSLKKMRLSDLAKGKGEFIGYSQGARDLVRKEFRDLVVEAGLVCIAHIVVVDDWLSASTENDRKFLGNARNFAFQGTLEKVANLAQIEDVQIALYLDEGAADIGVETNLRVWHTMRAAESSRTSLVYSAVEDSMGLQAADMIAYEAYNYGLHLLDPSKYPENPHFVDLRNRANVLFYSLHEDAMRKHLTEWRAIAKDRFGIDVNPQ